MKRLFVYMAFALLAVVAYPVAAAEKVTFEASSPLTVAVGEAFRVEFALNAKPEKDSFVAPTFEGFDVLAGPAESHGSSIQIVNGSMTKSISHTITFVLMAQEAGTHTIGEAAVTVDGTTYHTRPLPIEVIDENHSHPLGSQPQGGGQSQAEPQRDRQVEQQVASDDILMRTIVSRTSIFKGEPLRVTFKLYERANVAGYENVKFPSFNGFWAQEVDTGNGRRERETYNGKVYSTMVAREYLLYPQQTGTLTIDPAELTAIAQVVVQNNRHSNDPFEAFFGGGHQVYNVRRAVQSQRINVTVKPLPAGAPESFTGAVGRFTLDATYPSTPLAANSAATYTVKISGTGNMTFVQAPKLNLPNSFEQYNVKTTESTNTTSAGITGYRQFEFPFIARSEGSFEIEPVAFTYFDPERMDYVTLTTRPLTLDITPDAKGSASGEAVVMPGRGLSKEEVRMLGEDIRFMKMGSADLAADERPLMGSTPYWLTLAGILAIFGVLYLALRKQIRDSRNAVLMRGKRANKVAVQRFRVARKYMEEQNRHAFYEEMLRALWGYMGDKFNIPVANLTKEYVREELARRGVAVEEAQRFTAIITLCDEAQYSPVASSQMSDVYTEGVDLISRLESIIKR